jgi:MFS family permease
MIGKSTGEETASEQTASEQQAWERRDPYAALRLPEYRLFSIGRNASGLGDSMQSVVVGWELYQRTGKSMTLGWVGLIQALPIFLFALHAGHVADTYSRKRIAVIAQLAVCVASLLLAALSAAHAPIPLFFLCLLATASARAFGNPARGALLPQVVPLHLLSNAISWDTSVRRIAVMSGAALGGGLLAWSHHASFVYGTTATIGLISALLLIRITDRPASPSRGEPATWQTLMAGIHYIRRTSIILATITLDLFAVLLGGATTLMPVYARDILHVGPSGLGWLRAAPSAGALLTALSLAHLPAFRYPGRTMLWAVAGFGVATIVFGLSRSMSLSLTALFLLGALDMISVVVRQTLVQTLTPDAMRGRVNAVNSVFISTSNEVGGFESGLVAQFTSPLFSVVSGGVGTLVVVLAAALLWPPLRAYRPGRMATRAD